MERPQFDAYQTAVQEMPQLERSPGWKQALGYAAEAFRPTRGTGLGKRLQYRNLDEVTASQQNLKPLERLAQLEESQGELAMRGREAGTRERAVGVQEKEALYPRSVGGDRTYNPKTDTTTEPTPERKYSMEHGGYIDPADAEPEFRPIKGWPQKPEPTKIVRPGDYALGANEQGKPIAQQIEGLPEKEDQGSPTMAKFALRIAELENKPQKTPEEQGELTILKRAIGLARPERPTRARLGKNIAGQNVVFIEQEDGTVTEIPVKTEAGGESPKLEETPGRPTRKKPGSFTMPAAPVGGPAAPATPSPAPAESRGRLMTQQEFVADFIKEEGKPPSPEEMESLRGKVWQ